MKEIYNWFRKQQEYESLRQQEAEITSRRNWERMVQWINKEQEKWQKVMSEFNRQVKCRVCKEYKNYETFMCKNEDLCLACYHNPPKKYVRN